MNRQTIIRWLLTVTVAAGVVAAPEGAPARAEEEPSGVSCTPFTREDLWITMSDGVRLRLGLELPGGPFEEECAGAPYPVVLAYSPYSHGYSMVPHWRKLVEAGYGVIGVGARGTACSGGTYDPLSQRERKDIHEIIEWITTRWWSDGNVALAGDSFAAIEALWGAPDAPTALKAVVANSPSSDLYRDTIFPGGIKNVGVLGTTVVQAGTWTQTAWDTVVQRRDGECAANVVDSPGVGPAGWMYSDWDEGIVHDRSPIHDAPRIKAPVFFAIGWQDEVVGSRPVELLRELRVPYRAVLSNGGHAVSNLMGEEIVTFLDHHLKEMEGHDEPSVEVWWDTSMTSGPRWKTGFGRWPIPQMKPRSLYLSSDGVLTDLPPAAAGSDTYAYVPASGQSALAISPTAFDPTLHGLGIRQSALNQAGWGIHPKPGTYRAYTYQVDQDLVVAGSASLDLHLSSTAPDTDLQVVITEVRDGEEIYVAKGFLRASHRRLDEARSTPTRPYHTHQAPGMDLRGTEVVRVEVMPFAHAFRKGTELRLYIEAPSTIGEMALQSDRAPAVNSIHYGGVTPSALVLPEIPGIAPDPERTTCDPEVRRFCRPAAS